MAIAYKKIEANIFNHQFWVNITDPELLKNSFKNHLKKSNFTILKFNEHYFEQQGYTCFWLLGESHLAIHTFPESNKSYVELSSCNKEKLETFKLLTKNYEK